ncbi:coagulase, partial [Escherichia coli]|nr:coagulase [Escherichia coli]
VKKYEETVTKSPVVKEEKKVEEPQLPKVGNQQEVKTTAGKAEETTQPVAQPLVKIPQETIYGETVKGPE